MIDGVDILITENGFSDRCPQTEMSWMDTMTAQAKDHSMLLCDSRPLTAQSFILYCCTCCVFKSKQRNTLKTVKIFFN